MHHRGVQTVRIDEMLTNLYGADAPEVAKDLPTIPEPLAEAISEGNGHHRLWTIVSAHREAKGLRRIDGQH